MFMTIRDMCGAPVFHRAGGFAEFQPGRMRAEWVPPMDIAETGEAFKLRLEAPGVRREDMKIDYENGALTISCEKAKSADDDGSRSWLEERTHGSFSRSVRFSGVDADAITAVMKNGVLEIVVPKLVKPQPKKIEVTHGAA